MLYARAASTGRLRKAANHRDGWMRHVRGMEEQVGLDLVRRKARKVFQPGSSRIHAENDRV